MVSLRPCVSVANYESLIPNPDKPEEQKLIMKARKDENTKKIYNKFRGFYISCFRGEKYFAHFAHNRIGNCLTISTQNHKPRIQKVLLVINQRVSGIVLQDLASGIFSNGMPCRRIPFHGRPRSRVDIRLAFGYQT